MALDLINVGATYNDGTGDNLRTAGLKINGMVTELYARAPGNLSGLLAADATSHNYRVAVIGDVSFAGAANGLATLDSSGKVPTSQLPSAVLGSVEYQGTWDASTNTPAIPAAAAANKGFYYKVAVAGTTAIDGNASWNIGDWIVSNGASWDRINNTDAIQSVAGLTGIITGAGLKTALAISYGDVSGLGTAAQYNVGTGANNIVQRDASGNYPAGNGSAITGLTIAYPPGTLYGLTVSQNATQDYLDIATGKCRSIADDANMALSVAMTKNMGATWAAGTNAGGLAAGETMPVSGTLHVWLISKADGTTDVLGNIDALSGLSPTLPSGYVNKRRISSRPVRSSHVLAVSQRGNHNYLSTQVQDYAAPFGTASRTLVTLTVPTGIKVRPLFRINTNTTSDGILLTSPDEETDVAAQFIATFSTAPGYDAAAVSATNLNFAPFRTEGSLITNTAGQIGGRSSNGGSCYLYSRGWIDELDRFG